jgi:hypothetical protein
MLKKILFPVFVIFLLTVSFNQAFAATTFSFSPLTVKVKEGEAFTLKIKINPQGVKNYTIKADMKFPADLVGIRTWKFGDDWMPLRKSGYDYFSNVTGVLIRTAGYPEGFSEETEFGSAVFVAKKSGEATIEFTAQSLALDETNQNTYAKSENAVITIEPGETVSEVTPEITNPSDSNPEQLFDINLELDQPKVKSISELSANVTMLSFGKVPTPVDLTFDILDSSGQVVHTEKGSVTVETEKVYNKRFTGFDLAPGNYTLRLTTLYNTSVSDEFVQPFEIVKPEAPTNQYLPWVIGGGILLIVIILIIIFKRKRKKGDRDYYKN